MMSAYLDPETAAAPYESRPKSAFGTWLSRFRRLFSEQPENLDEQLGCAHEQLVFDEINDVYCAHCRKDFTG
ncbi:MAG TPA: hypothetical protein VFV69_15710 [Steroidobacteraceae bacterium]|jgi:hypothetical protein|nr:hypothetical protein [Steroidobacteraceae bacterium]HJY42146.1 hypothetical protein [Steroidobacteraceae bacterium]